MLAIDINLDSETPVYRQVVDEVTRLIAQGQLREGDTLPSVRQLGAMIGVNLNTVARAYRILAEEGYLEVRHGARARIKVALPAGTGAEADEETLQRLHGVIGRMVLAGADREQVESLLDEAVQRFFGPGRSGGRT